MCSTKSRHKIKENNMNVTCAARKHLRKCLPGPWPKFICASRRANGVVRGKGCAHALLHGRRVVPT